MLWALGGTASAVAACPDGDPVYTDACGPSFVLPGWGDAGGWTDPSKYSTIQLADVNGDGRDELLARNDQGLEVWSFDTTLGQWRPQVDAKDVPVAIPDFRSPQPGEVLESDFTKPQYYSTIQAGNVDGEPGDEIFARFADGLRVYQYVPPAGSTSIDGGSWQTIGSGGPFGDAVGGDDPGIYSTIRLVDVGFRIPVFFGRRHVTDDEPGPLEYDSLYQGVWRGTSDLEDPLPQPLYSFGDEACGLPACYLSMQGAAVAPEGNIPDYTVDPPSGDAPARPNQILLRTAPGVAAYTWAVGENLWFAAGTDPAPDWPYGLGAVLNGPTGPFADVPSADCPFSDAGASGAGSGDCLGTSPAYYETLQAADVDGRPGEELLARASDGLRVRRWNGNGYDWLATLTDLAGAASTVAPGAWGSIRTADLDGDGKDEVLALDGKALQAWSYDRAANAWTKLAPNPALRLTGDWLSDPAYFATLRTGDVDGDGHDDVTARGPYGIRTWFYDRRDSGGWERYLPEAGYAAFPAAGQQAAFAQLNATAKATGVVPLGDATVRGVWTGEDAPESSDLSALQQGILSFAGCTGLNPGVPPSYQSCTPPAGSAGFDAADWTAVVNELLAEIAAQQQIDAFYYGSSNSLSSARAALFISEGATLPAILGDLQLAGAAGNEADFNVQGFFAGSSGIAASLAGLIPAGGAEASAALWVLSELISMLPSASPSATASFQTTYAGLQDRFATIIQETQNALDSQNQQVRSDQALSTLVGQLRARGTWKLDEFGMRSAGNQGFALWIYQELLPTMYQRYVITNCSDQTIGKVHLTCFLPSTPYVIGNTDGKGTKGTWLSSDTGGQCTTETSPKTGRTDEECAYGDQQGLIPDSLADKVWGPLTGDCTYTPGSTKGAWTFGNCSLGVPLATSLIADSSGWSFTTQTGDPACCEAGAVRATAGRVVARAAAPGASPTGRRDTLGPLRFAGRAHVPRALRLRWTRVRVRRTLFDHGGRAELARTRSGRRLRPFALERTRSGAFVSRGRRVPKVTLTIRRREPRGRAKLDLRLDRVHTRDLRALCFRLPAATSRDGRPLELETRLRLRDGARTSGITLRQRWRCARDGKGEFAAIRPVKPRRVAARPGLALRVDPPRRPVSGRRATVRVTVVNLRRRSTGRSASSLWNLRIAGTAGGRTRTLGVAEELRAGRSKTVRLSVRVPRDVRRPLCVRVAARADSARTARAERCARTESALRFTG